MLSIEDNELLTRVGPGTPMGNLLRRFWTPVLLASEVPRPDGPPVRVTIMGEQLVAFKDTSGKVGLVQASCPHRHAGLFWGRNEEHGLRCVYHGWKYDVDGNCVDMPSEPDASNFKSKIKIKAYPTVERGQLIWAYLGPSGLKPSFPELEWTRVPDDHVIMTKRSQETNWAQAVEGGIDSSHISFLHGGLPPARRHEAADALRDETGPTVRRYTLSDTRPAFEIRETGYGMLIGARRAAESDTYYWRITQFLMPWYTMIPGSTEAGNSIGGHAWVPIDDANVWAFSLTWNGDRPITGEERERLDGSGIHAEVDDRFRPVRNSGNDYLIDREEQARRTFTGIRGIGEQDMAVQESMSPIVPREEEHLGTSDLAVIAYRRLLLRAARELDEGHEPYAAAHGELYHVRSASVVIDREAPFHEGAAERLRART